MTIPRLMRADLNHARAHAPDLRAAMRSFVGIQRLWWSRRTELGWARHCELATLELACAQAGLSYGAVLGLAAGAPPWRMPESLLSAPVSSLPAHPLLDPMLLAALTKSSPAVGAADALRQLLLPDGLPARWQGIPIFNPARSRAAAPARVAVCLHLFYPELWPQFSLALASLQKPWDLFVTVPRFACTPALAPLVLQHPAVQVLPCENRGRDVLPFLQLLQAGAFDGYDAVLKLHTKRSPHRQDGERWLTELLDALIGNAPQIARLLAVFHADQTLGMIGPGNFRVELGDRLHRGNNQRELNRLLARAGLPAVAAEAPFFAGTMFWFRPSALNALRRIGLSSNDFPLEMGQTDGTMAHAVERLLVPLVHQAGFDMQSV